MSGTKIRRQITVGHQTCILGFSGRESVDSAVFDTSSLGLGGVDEVQTLTITGTPTGGTIKLAFKGQTTGTIAFNATAATVQAALRALSRVGPGLTVSGSAGGPYTITFTGLKLGKQDQPLITVANNSLTGGTTPNASVVEATKGDSTYAGLYVIRSGIPLMANGGGDKVIQWDGASAATLVGIFDGLVELLDPSDFPIIPVYNHNVVFDKDRVLNYGTWTSNYNTWAAAHVCQFKSQGS